MQEMSRVRVRKTLAAPPVFEADQMARAVVM
jgi:hypothetical protein